MEKIPPLRTRRVIDPPTWGGHCGLVAGMFDCGGSNLTCAGTLTSLPVVHDWVNNGLGMSSLVCATGHIKDPLPLIKE